MEVPKARPNCKMFMAIEDEIAELLKVVEWYNDKILEQFWRLNIES